MLLRAVITMQGMELGGRCPLLSSSPFFFAKYSGKRLTATRTIEVYRFNGEIYRVDDCVDSANVFRFFLIGLVTRQGLFLLRIRMELSEKDWNCLLAPVDEITRVNKFCCTMVVKEIYLYKCFEGLTIRSTFVSRMKEQKISNGNRVVQLLQGWNVLK